MSVLYFDAYSGVSGDMILASLFDLGIEKERWLKALAGLSVTDYEVHFKRAKRHGISAQRAEVKVADQQPTRRLSDIKKIVNASKLPVRVQENALSIFTTLAKAEAKVHGTSLEKVHFHEVGAVDAIVDIVGTCLALDILEVNDIYCTPIGVGRGISKSAHGPMPLPPPATLEILTGFPIHVHDVDVELATPTGSAILKTLAAPGPPPAELVLQAVGVGAGSRTVPELPNVLRALLLQSVDASEVDRAALLETNIDDMNPELYPYVIEKLLQAGAMDAYLNPIVMKKGRPGVVLSVLCSPELRSTMIDVIYRETTTLGIRISIVDRLKLSRKEIIVETEYGPIKGKEAYWKGKVRRTPEFEACRKLSSKQGIPLQDVYHSFHAATEWMSMKK